jgi:hypothetical protein
MLLKSGSGGGTKPSLSPFGIVLPNSVDLGTFSQSPNKSPNFTNQPFGKTPIVNPKSGGGVSFRQASVLSYVQPVVNNGTPGRVCFNWAYNDDLGVTDFDRAVYTKAGGVSLLARTVGTLSTPESTGEDVPFVDDGATALSSSFNVKNNGTTLAVCPVFDGVTYYTNILDPQAEQKTFDPDDATTFPPNYDDQVNFPFPGYDFE